MNMPHKGVFWIICAFEEKANGVIRCDFTGASIVSLYTDDAPVSHKNAWPAVEAEKTVKKHPWNHYPRGRVELRRGSALVFAHPAVIADNGICRMITERCGLTETASLRFIADGSAHYGCHADERSKTL